MSRHLERTRARRPAGVGGREHHEDGRHRCAVQARRWFRRFGPFAIVAGRFVVGVRVFIGALLAAHGVSYPRYLFYGCAAALLWSATWILPGVALGEGGMAWAGSHDGPVVVFTAALGVVTVGPPLAPDVRRAPGRR